MKIVTEAREWFESLFIRNVPGSIGRFLRRMYWTSRFCQCSSFALYSGCVITAPERMIIGSGILILCNCSLHAHNKGSLKIGNGVCINSNVMLNAADDGEIIIGNDVIIGPNVVIRASNHRYSRRDLPIKAQGHKGGRIVIGDDVWIGANAVILPDVTIGSGAVIGAGAVVSKNIPPFALAVGVPAKVIKENCRIGESESESR